MNLPAIGLMLTGLVLVVGLGRWGGELQTTVRVLSKGLETLIASQQRGDEMVISLRIDRHKHGTEIKSLKEQVASIEDDVGELMHGRRKGDVQP